MNITVRHRSFAKAALLTLTLSIVTPCHAVPLVLTDVRSWPDNPAMRVDDGFGRTFAADGTTMVVGAPDDDIGAAEDRGSVHVFTLTGGIWTRGQQLAPPIGAPGKHFGESIALRGDRLLVGAPGRFGIDGASVDGAAFLYRREGATWVLDETWQSTDGSHGITFGTSVALDSDVAFVGDPNPGCAVTPCNQVYVFRSIGADWIASGTARVPTMNHVNSLGATLFLRPDGTLFVGAPSENDGAHDGAVHVFQVTPSAVNHVARLVAGGSGTNAGFGLSLASDGDWLAVGTLGEARSGVGGERGSVMLLERSGGAWVQRQTLLDTPSAGRRAISFGRSLSLVGDRLIANIPADTNDSGDFRFGMHSFLRSGASWSSVGRAVSGTNAPYGGTVQWWNGRLLAGGMVPVSIVGVAGVPGVLDYPQLTPPWSNARAAFVPPGIEDARFGQAVARLDDLVLVGAPRPRLLGKPIGGVVHVHARVGTRLVPIGSVAAAGGAANSDFGAALAGDGNVALIGAPSESIGGTFGIGAVHVATRAGQAISLTSRIDAPSPATEREFGRRVALTPTHAFVGVSTIEAGAVDVFARSGSTFVFSQQIKSELGLDDFAKAFDASGSRVAVTDSRAGPRGGVRVFTLSGNQFVLTATVTPPASLPNASLRGDVHLDDDVLLASGFNDRPAVFRYVRSGDAWNFVDVISPAFDPDEVNFGKAIERDGTSAVIIGTRLGNLVAYVVEGIATTPVITQKLLPPNAPASDSSLDSLVYAQDALVIGSAFGTGSDPSASAGDGAVYLYSDVLFADGLESP